MTDRTYCETTISFTAEGKPQGKQRARRGKGGHWYTPVETVRYEAAVAYAAMQAKAASNQPMTFGPVEIEVRCFFPDARVRDADNVLKSVLDGCNGVVYLDDSQVTRAIVTKEIDRNRPRTEVDVCYTD